MIPLTAFLGRTLSALYHAVIENHLVKTFSTGRSNHLGWCLIALDKSVTIPKT
jgi:hypothetical protein